MQIFTIRQSIHKIKIFENVSESVNAYKTLLANRDIEWRDLFVYRPLVTVNNLPHAYNFEYGEGETVENATEIKFYTVQSLADYTPTMLDWFNIPFVSQATLYTEIELEDIAFNLEQSDNTTWREVPQKEVLVLEEVEEKIYTLTIPVERLTE